MTQDRADEQAICVQIASACETIPGEELLRSWVHCALGSDTTGELTLRIVDDPEGTAINERYRRGRGATNVLAFAAEILTLPMEEGPAPLGDLVICAPVLQQEAAAQGKRIEAHWAHIVIHGALHLLGYDHESAADAGKMESREIELLATLGFDNPYASEI